MVAALLVLLGHADVTAAVGVLPPVVAGFFTFMTGLPARRRPEAAPPLSVHPDPAELVVVAHTRSSDPVGVCARCRGVVRGRSRWRRRRDQSARDRGASPWARRRRGTPRSSSGNAKAVISGRRHCCFPILLTQAVTAGASAFLVADLFLHVPSIDAVRWTLLASLGVAALLIATELVSGATAQVHLAVQAMTRGRYARRFWFGGVLLGLLVPAGLATLALAGGPAPSALSALAGIAAVAGLAAFEDAFVRAGQSVPLSLGTSWPTSSNSSTPPLDRSTSSDCCPVRRSLPIRPSIAGTTTRNTTPVEWRHGRKVKRRYSLIPTTCFNCEACCGLLAYVDKQTGDIRKLEGNPAHPASRGRNCAKGPATLTQVYDPERILYPLKRAGARGSGSWQRITWDDALRRDRRPHRHSVP